MGYKIAPRFVAVNVRSWARTNRRKIRSWLFFTQIWNHDAADNHIPQYDQRRL